MSKDFTTVNKTEYYAIVEKESGKVLATRGTPRLFLGWKGPAQLLGKGIKNTKETATHKVIRVALVTVGE
jgi:hypothetical protein